ncbi:hypothetical protein BDR06DRAFT_969437 [Suillus hirtellus]|nr:hypothetical protein BDR06DRAFT_969437 [Suillus hirtellus]
MPNAEFSNTAMADAAEQLMKIVQKAAKLRDGHPNHLKLAAEIGDLMSLVFKTHVWARIQTDDPQIQQHPLKEKAHSITVARLVVAVKTSASISSALALTKTSKQLKVIQESVFPKHNVVKDDIMMNPQMDMDNSHNELMKVLEVMMLEVMQDLANLSIWNVTLQEIAQTLWTNIAQLMAENTTTTEQLNVLQNRITAQNAAILELHHLRAEVMVLQDQVKTLQEESATRDQHLQHAHHKLGQQEHTTAILQDAYNTISPTPVVTPRAGCHQV